MTWPTPDILAALKKAAAGFNGASEAGKTGLYSHPYFPSDSAWQFERDGELFTLAAPAFWQRVRLHEARSATVRGVDHSSIALGYAFGFEVIDLTKDRDEHRRVIGALLVALGGDASWLN